MKKPVYLAGKTFQITALLAMPFSIWIGHLGHNEKGAIVVFLGSIFAFAFGYVLTRLSARL